MPVPPAWATRAVVKLRNGLGRARGRLAPPFLLTLEHLQGMIDAKALAVAVELDLPDALAGGPRTADELAAAVDGDADAIDRLLRFLVSRGFFRRDRRGRYRNNAASDGLRRDAEWGARNWVLFFGSAWHWRIWNEAAHSFRTGESASVRATGHEFFDYVNRVDADAGAAFNGAMNEGSRLQGLLLVEAYEFDGVRSLCDVGGGEGTILADVLDHHPGMRGAVFDLPALEPGATARLQAAGVGERGEFVGGDFFADVPAGHDLYTLFAIVHDWDDDRCVTILGNVRRAMGPDARVLVTEMPIPESDEVNFAKVMDLEMLILTGSGRERTEAQYRALFARAGLRVERTLQLATGFTVFELRA